MSCFADVTSMRAQRIWDGVVGRAVYGENLTLALVELDPGCVIPEHSHPNEQVGLIVRGSLSFRIADETAELGPGGNWCIPPNVPHEVRTGPAGAVVIETFAPARTDWPELERLPDHAPQWPE